MRTAIFVMLGVIGLVGPAVAGEHKAPQFTTLDACALKGRGIPLADGKVCLEVTGGINYWQSWGNAEGGQGTGIGETIVTTPAGTSTIPIPRR